MHGRLQCVSWGVQPFWLFWATLDKELSGATREVQECPECSLQISRAYICLLCVILGHSIVIYKVSL